MRYVRRVPPRHAPLRVFDALFQLALERGVLDAMEADVRRLAGEVSDPDVAAYLADASVTDEEKISRLEKVLSDMNELLGDFVRLLFEKGRIEVLLEAGDAYRLRLLEHRGATEGRVESARRKHPVPARNGHVPGPDTGK